MSRFRVYWGNVDLGWTDSLRHAHGVISQHLRERQRRGGQRGSTAMMRTEYRVEREGEGGRHE